MTGRTGGDEATGAGVGVEAEGAVAIRGCMYKKTGLFRASTGNHASCSFTSCPGTLGTSSGEAAVEVGEDTTMTGRGKMTGLYRASTGNHASCSFASCRVTASRRVMMHSCSFSCHRRVVPQRPAGRQHVARQTSPAHTARPSPKTAHTSSAHPPLVRQDGE